MYGAFIGDMEGSTYEFDQRAGIPYAFDLLRPECFLTDDSVMTLAVLDILRQGDFSEKAIFDAFRKWGRRYPRAGYGLHFIQWLYRDDYVHAPSYGNGAAMRISPVGWYAHSVKEVKSLSKAITEVSHDSPEGLEGAEVTAMMIYYARKGKSKAFLKTYAQRHYVLYSSYGELRHSNHGHGLEICQVSVPQAISAFLISKDFEDCLRLIVSAGGDCDTTGAIACSIAEAYYHQIPPALIRMVLERLEGDLEAYSLVTEFGAGLSK